MLLMLSLPCLLLLLLRATPGAPDVGECNGAGGTCLSRSLCSPSNVIQIQEKMLRRECGQRDAVCCLERQAVSGEGRGISINFNSCNNCSTSPFCEAVGGVCRERYSCKAKEAFGLCGNTGCTCCLEGSHMCSPFSQYSHKKGQCVRNTGECIGGYSIQYGCKCNLHISGRQIPLVGYFCASKAEHGTTWEYRGNHGPNSWSIYYPECRKDQQSPVDFNTNSIQHWVTKSPLQFIGYNIKPSFLEITNNGHTVSVFWGSAHPPQIAGGLLPDTYTLAKFHFHWGKDSSRGSEHTFNGKVYPLEMHLVHFNNSYGSLGEAVKYKNGIAVLSVMFKVTSHNNIALDPIIRSLGSLTHPHSEVTIPYEIALWHLLPLNLGSFFSYQGSLTTPSCSQAVIWTVFTHTSDISEQQLSMFRKLLNSNGEYLQDNFRPTQPLNNRRVYLVNVQRS